ncbi:hypothetical protein HY024_00955, partial [Candidatus Curtissbacteria bacterium]|nr:hypothetical protein [Candidatus Curtissbacteria bacterium]
DQESQLGGQFRQFGERPVFNINSRSHRRFNLSTLGLPGGNGDLNTFGSFAPLHLPYFVKGTYPTNLDLGEASAVNHFVSGPDTLLNAKYFDGRLLPNGKVRAVFQKQETRRTISVDARMAFFAVGLGSEVSEGGFGMTSSALLRHFGSKEEKYPMQKFVGADVVLIGDGDSAAVVAEVFCRRAPNEAYGYSVPQFGNARRLIWVGVNAETCSELKANVRDRYNGGIADYFPGEAGEKMHQYLYCHLQLRCLLMQQSQKRSPKMWLIFLKTAHPLISMD